MSEYKRIVNIAQKTHQHHINSAKEQEILWDVLDEIPFEHAATIFDPDYSLPRELAQLESKRIQEALNQSDGNKTVAADYLGIGRTNLIAKIKKYF